MSPDRLLNFSISPAPSLHLHRCSGIINHHKHTALAPPTTTTITHHHYTPLQECLQESVWRGTTGTLITAPATLTPPPLRAVIERHCGDAAVVFSNDFFFGWLFPHQQGAS